MDEMYLDDFDPRNAPNLGFAFNRPYVGPARALPVRRPPMLGAVQNPQPRPAYYPLPAPAYYPPQVPYYPPQAPVYAAPGSRFGRKLADLTVGDIAPLLALGIIAFRPMPAAPSDEGRVDANVVNQTRYLNGIANHFHTDQQLFAVGQALGKLFG